MMIAKPEPDEPAPEAVEQPEASVAAEAAPVDTADPSETVDLTELLDLLTKAQRKKLLDSWTYEFPIGAVPKSMEFDVRDMVSFVKDGK